MNFKSFGMLILIVITAIMAFSIRVSAADQIKFKRSFGVLLHPTSLPGRYGIGDLGEAAYKFVDYLKLSGATLWQTLPMGPTGFGDSPYACFSAFAGNPLLISPDMLVAEGLLVPADIEYIPAFSETKVNFGLVINYKRSLFNKAYENFRKLKSGPAVREYESFLAENDALWLDDFALFMALKERNNGAVWSDWDRSLVRREKKAISIARSELRDQIGFFKFLQFEFFKQWLALKKYANANGVKLVGDIPIFVAYDGADAWVHPEIFCLDAKGKPVAVAGVPPDFFSKTGQYWGNPVYDWKALKRSGFAWWIARFKNTLVLFDIIRIDHFRGFEAYWEIPASEKTAVNGKWVKAPGLELFRAIRKSLGTLPIIAEDLGVITPEVERLRDEFGFYGMKILQFGFSGNDGDAAKYLPHTFNSSHALVYTGTHDNETTAGWYENLDPKVQKFVRDYTGSDGKNVARDMVKLAMSSVCDIAIVPFQDIIGIDNAGRMNTPGTFGEKNWSYRLRGADLKMMDALQIKKYCRLFGR
ncbi:MAG TPA: 4-alpha-glucanotransferase [Candidatus Wallbacteria bacterium]|nr:4-alpha-glucanotransferase [Candidatus Wallbacteria bacterium]